MDYAGLQAEAKKLVNRDDEDIDARLIAAVRRAEERLNLDLRLRTMLVTTPVALTNGRGVLPDDFLAFNVPDGKETYDFSVDGESLVITPSKGYCVPSTTVDFTYYAEIPALTEADPTNWLLEKYPTLYSYCACFELSLDFELQGGPMTAKWQGMYAERLDRVRKTDLRARFNTQNNRRRRARP